MKKKLKSLCPADATPCSASSDTPETDEATLKAADIDCGGTFAAVHVQVSKRLERERNAAREASELQLQDKRQMMAALDAKGLMEKNDTVHGAVMRLILQSLPNV